MRITNSMLVNSFLSDMKTNLNNMKSIQSKITSGKEISKPSDDPFKVARSMQLNSAINANKQYNQNIKDIGNYLDVTDTALNQAENVLQRVRELLVAAGNGAYGTEEKTAIKNEIRQKLAELSQCMNTNFDGSYVFGGSRGTDKPLNDDCSYYMPVGATEPNVEINKIKTKLSVEISPGVEMDYNVSASDVMEFTNENGNSISVKDLLGQIVNHLDGRTDDGTPGNTDSVSDIVGKDLQGITDSINNLLKVRSQVGANQNRMESAEAKNEDENYNLTDILSSIEDIDITEKIMEYSTMQTVYMASLQTSAKVIQPSLLDYLR
ncbi:MAG: flagellar hook-associated protein FlgL [Bacillota bacterium]|nr:flagellar hook-associated protein FlgL [Bacillota bacterium]